MNSYKDVTVTDILPWQQDKNGYRARNFSRKLKSYLLPSQDTNSPRINYQSLPCHFRLQYLPSHLRRSEKDDKTAYWLKIVMQIGRTVQSGVLAPITSSTARSTRHPNKQTNKQNHYAPHNPHTLRPNTVLYSHIEPVGNCSVIRLPYTFVGKLESY